MAFVPNPENKDRVNHKNGVRADNRAENLEWVTAKENTQHSIHVLGNAKKMPRGEQAKNAKLNDAAVREIRARHGTVPVSFLATKFGVNDSTISNVAARRVWAHVDA